MKQKFLSDKKSAFSLVEILLTIALIAGLMALVTPCWSMLARIRARQTASALVVGSLEQARQIAITGKNNTWLILRHEKGASLDSLRLVGKQNSTTSPLDTWQKLPSGVSFSTTQNSLMNETPPREILSVALNNQTPPPGTLFGAVMFQSSGRIGVPLLGGNSLIVQLDSISSSTPALITLSRATGRAICK